MCGIIGYTGIINAPKILLKGLSELEYRGYDSSGIALLENETVTTFKTIGKVADLKEKVSAAPPLSASCGIGHTRWATHGGVTDTNAHPHTAGKVTLIHNGIIENYREIAQMLESHGKTALSQTDTEIAAMLLDHLYKGNPEEAIKKAVELLEGAYAFCILFADYPDTVYSIRNSSPLVAAFCKEGSFVASDVTALVDYTKDYFVIPEHHIAVLSKQGIVLKTLDDTPVEPDMLHVTWDTTTAQKGGFDTFMQKEIYEQPEAILSTILPRIKDHQVDFSTDGVPDELFLGINRIIVSACGTAMYAGMVGRYMIEKLARIPVTVEVASEFRYQNPIIDEHTLVLIISQSGETADTLAALRLAKEKGAKTLSIVNVKGSTIARESNYVLYTHAGPEIAVASTKAFTVQSAVLYLIAFKLAKVLQTVEKDTLTDYCTQMLTIPDIVKKALTLDSAIQSIAKELINTNDVFYIGRDLDYPMCCEGSLKLKEITYIHSEAYPSGELKHGAISLIDDGVPIIALATRQNVSLKILSNIQEVTARGGEIILITTPDVVLDTSIYKHQVILPFIPEDFSPFVTSVAVQLLALHTSILKGRNVDKPRNLAKSVTVE